MMTDIIFHLIYLKSGMTISKKHYNDWREIQDEYENYVADLSFMSCEDIINFFEEEFCEEDKFPFTKNELLNFAESDNIILSTS